jgi:cell wall-associated NlpC family hydrolase
MIRKIFNINFLFFTKSFLVLSAGIFILLCTGCFSSSKARAEKKYKANVITFPPEDSAATQANQPEKKIKYHSLQLEYSKKLSVSPDSISNLRLYSFIKQWIGTPYVWGGNSTNGIDCSAFVQRLYRAVYDINVPRTSIEQFFARKVELYSNTKYLVEGDLVFFKTISNSNAVTHVGFYLRNGYFINASSSKGVSIGNLYDDYWSDRYVASGRLKNSFKY